MLVSLSLLWAVRSECLHLMQALRANFSRPKLTIMHLLVQWLR